MAGRAWTDLHGELWGGDAVAAAVGPVDEEDRADARKVRVVGQLCTAGSRRLERGVGRGDVDVESTLHLHLGDVDVEYGEERRLAHLKGRNGDVTTI